MYVCTCIHNTYIGQTHIHTSPCWVHFVVSLYTGSNQTTLHWTTITGTGPWERLLVALLAVTKCLCLGVNLQMSLLPYQYVHRYCRSPGLSMRISKRDCFPADSLLLWAPHFPSLSKKEILLLFSYHAIFYLWKVWWLLSASALSPYPSYSTYSSRSRVIVTSSIKVSLLQEPWWDAPTFSPHLSL